LVDPTAGLQDQGEERSPAQLRNPQLDVTGLSGQQPRPGTIAFVGSGVGALVAGGADQLGRFDFDQLLQHHANRLTDQFHGFAGA
jgi:hypothetical protein